MSHLKRALDENGMEVDRIGAERISSPRGLKREEARSLKDRWKGGGEDHALIPSRV